MKRKYIIWIVIFSVVSAIFLFFMVSHNSTETIIAEEVDSYSSLSNNIDFDFEGKVTKSRELGILHNMTMISVNITQSDVKNYDGRHNSEYYLVLKNDKAELLIGGIEGRRIFKNDILKYEGDKNKMTLIRNGEKIRTFAFPFKPNSGLLDDFQTARKMHEIH